MSGDMMTLILLNTSGIRHLVGGVARVPGPARGRQGQMGPLEGVGLRLLVIPEGGVGTTPIIQPGVVWRIQPALAPACRPSRKAWEVQRGGTAAPMGQHRPQPPPSEAIRTLRDKTHARDDSRPLGYGALENRSAKCSRRSTEKSLIDGTPIQPFHKVHRGKTGLAG